MSKNVRIKRAYKYTICTLYARVMCSTRRFLAVHEVKIDFAILFLHEHALLEPVGLSFHRRANLCFLSEIERLPSFILRRK